MVYLINSELLYLFFCCHNYIAMTFIARLKIRIVPILSCYVIGKYRVSAHRNNKSDKMGKHT